MQQRRRGRYAVWALTVIKNLKQVSLRPWTASYEHSS
jgi:hypothetical protein